MDIIQAIELLRQTHTPDRRDDIHHLVSIDWSPPAPRPLDLSARSEHEPQPAL